MPSDSVVSIVSLLPDLFGAYGDYGNTTILAKRLEWRGVHAKTITVKAGDVIPESGDIYIIGGGEDALQTEAVRTLGDDGPLSRVVALGSAVVAICGGLQILGNSFQLADGSTHEGLGLLDVDSSMPHGPRHVGEVLVKPDAEWNLPVLTGFENHAGLTRRGPNIRRIGAVTTGTGSGWGDEGVIDGRVVGTYLHGPVMARNPALADMVLGWALNTEMEPFDDGVSDIYRQERIDAVSMGDAPGRRPWSRLISRN